MIGGDALSDKTTEFDAQVNNHVGIPKSASVPSMLGTTRDTDILKKIPDGAEAASILVGNVDFLKKPLIAFVRLAQGECLQILTLFELFIDFFFILHLLFTFIIPITDLKSRH